MLGFQLRGEPTRGWAELAAEVGNWIITGVATATVAETYQALARCFRRNRENRERYTEPLTCAPFSPTHGGNAHLILIWT